MKKYSRSAFALALLHGSVGSAFAQQAVPAGSSPEGAAQGPVSPEIVVTAQRRAESLQRVPISVSAIPSAKLAAANITTTADLAAITPALTLSVSNGNMEPRIRGLGNSSAGPSVENSVATYIDGVYIASSPGSLLSLENVQRIEVLDGPQGTLFGRNATGGLVQIVTKDPKSTFGGNADISYENYQKVRFGLYATGPVAKGVDADLAVYVAHQGEGYGKNLFDGSDTYQTKLDFSARSKWLIRPGDYTTLRLSFDISDLTSSDPAFSTPQGFRPTFGAQPADVQAILDRNRYDVNQNSAVRRHLFAAGVSARIDQEVGSIMLTDIAAYRRTNFNFQFDADGLPIQAVQQIAGQQDEQITNEIQIAPVHSGRLQWIGGVYFYHLDSGYTPLENLVGAPPRQTISLSMPTFSTQSIAGYGQATYEVLPHTRLTAGFRYTNETRHEAGVQGTINAAGVTTLAPIPPARTSTNTPTWRIALDHQFGNVLGYISWNRGFKSGGFNPTVVTQPPYQPERLDDYEIGEKATLFGGRGHLNAAFFYYDYRNIQVNTFINSLAVIYNGAGAREYGIDATFDYALDKHLTISGGITAIHDRFTTFPLAVLAYQNPNGTVSTMAGSAKGNRLPFAPDVTASLGLDYKTSLAGGDLDLFVNDLYNSGYYGQVDNFLRQGAFHQLNASVQFRPAHSALSIKAYARNLTNAAVAEFLAISSTGPAVSYQAPRTYGVTLAVKF